jgi:tetratricopeptide (TPR) repeat protein
MRKRLLLWLARGVHGFFAWNTRALVYLTLWRAGVIRRRGDWKKGADEMAAMVGLEDADFADPARALAKIRERLADVNPDTALLFFMQMSTFLVDDKKQEWVAAVHELDAGLHPGDYYDLKLVAERLRNRTQNRSPMVRFLYGFRLANVLGLAERSIDELAVLEAHLGLWQQDYQDPTRLRSMLAARPEIFPDLWAVEIQMLASTLGNLGRRTESVAVLEAALGLSAMDYTDPGTLRSKIMAAVGPLESRAGSSLAYLSLLAEALQNLGRISESISLYEADLGLDPTDYRDISRLGAKIRARRALLPPEMEALSMDFFLSALIAAQRFDDGLAVLGADLGIDLTQIDGESLISKLRTRCESLPGNHTGFYLGLAAFTLAAAGRPREAVAVLAADSDLSVIDWRDTAALATRLEDRLGDLVASTRLLYVEMLVSALQIADQEEQAALLTDAYLRVVSPIGKEPPDPGLMAMSCELYADWMIWWGRNAERKPLEICRKLVPYLRHTLAEQGVVLVDRERFIRGVSDLRHRIVQTGLYWAEQEIDSNSANELRRTVLLWDLELSQRLLVERLLLTEIHPLPVGEPPPSGLWPLSESPPSEESYLPSSGETATFLGVLGTR